MTFQGHRNVGKPDGSTADAWQLYVCGHCGTKVSGAVVAVYFWAEPVGREARQRSVRWLLCTHCARGSVDNDGIITPGVAFGPDLEGIPEPVDSAYAEARGCMSVNAYTAAELICRKILMHIAVEKGADERRSFSEYLAYLEEQGYVTPPMSLWVDLIRRHANEATHRVATPDKTRAESTVMLTAELLRLVYEMAEIAKGMELPTPQRLRPSLPDARPVRHGGTGLGESDDPIESRGYRVEEPASKVRPLLLVPSSRVVSS